MPIPFFEARGYNFRMAYATIQDSLCRLTYTVQAEDLNGYGIMHVGCLLG